LGRAEVVIHMLYIFHGSNTTKSSEKAHTLVASLRTKRPDAAFVTIDADHWSSSIIEEHLGGQGLFSNKYIVFLDRVTENALAKEEIADFTEVMNESANIFIVLEGKLNAELKRSFEKNAEKVVESEEAKVTKKEEFNIFALADALGARDSFKSWTSYREAIEKGNESESVLCTLF
jgi:DNA polymerase III delta subunit